MQLRTEKMLTELALTFGFIYFGGFIGIILYLVGQKRKEDEFLINCAYVLSLLCLMVVNAMIIHVTLFHLV